MTELPHANRMLCTLDVQRQMQLHLHLDIHLSHTCKVIYTHVVPSCYKPYWWFVLSGCVSFGLRSCVRL